MNEFALTLLLNILGIVVGAVLVVLKYKWDERK